MTDKLAIHTAERMRIANFWRRIRKIHGNKFARQVWFDMRAKPRAWLDTASDNFYRHAPNNGKLDHSKSFSEFWDADGN